MAVARAGRVVLITGCSSGFGRAMVGAFLDEGWTVVATLRRAGERSALLGAERQRHPSKLVVLPLDVTSDDERRAAAVFVQERWARLDCLVSNAGRALFGPLEDVTPGQLREQVEVNALGPALLIRECLPLLRAARGRVIAISSLFGTAGFPLTAAYCGGKFALEGIAAALREELRPHGVQVAIVEPGRHRTGFATRADWAAGGGASPYAPATAAYRALAERLAAGPGAPAERLARAVVTLAARRRMPARVRVGRDAWAAHWLRRLLPERCASALWSALCARALRPRPEPPDPRFEDRAGAPARGSTPRSAVGGVETMR
jgi:NAD(P)-dependent dehydrogenase (short-subunit alcohol dehydrogenase family)